MSDRSEWLESIVTLLADSLGTSEQKRTAYKAAADFEANLPSGSPRAERWAEPLKRLFTLWVERMHYLRPEEGIDHRLPESVDRSDVEVAAEYGLRTSKGIEDRQKQLYAAGECRVERCANHLRVGWEPEMCVCFVCSKQEWRRALQKAGRMAA